MKRLTSLILALVSILTVCGCSYSENNVISETSPQSNVGEVSDVVAAYLSKSANTSNETKSLAKTSSTVKKKSKTKLLYKKTDSSNKKPKGFKITISFLGDMMLASFKDKTTKGSFNEYAKKKSPEYFLKNVSSILKKDDFTVANLENVLSDSKKLKPAKKGYTPAYWYKSKTGNIKILTSAGVDSVLLNNNHTRDYGKTGLTDTMKTVRSAGLKYGYDNDVIYFKKKGFKIAIICARFWNKSNINYTVNKIKAARKNSDYQIVYFHGSDDEETHYPTELRIKAARKYVDSGADLVIGGHPHNLQPREVYKGKEIVYSVGNFCYGGAKYPENRTIIYQQTITVNSKSLKVTGTSSKIIPCYVYTGKVNNYQPAVIKNKTHKKRVMDFMNGKRKSPL